MPRPRCIPRLVVAGLVALTGLVSTAVPSTASAAAPGPLDRTRIDITLVAPPASPARPRLYRSGSDVTDTYCTDGPAEGGDPSATVGCVDLPDGTYSVGLVDAPAGTAATTECIDVVAASAEQPVIGNGFRQWSCWVYAEAPGVVLGAEVLDNLIVTLPEPPRVVVTDSSGEVVSDDCADVRLFGADRQWCDALAEGTYTATLAPLANGYRGSVGCHPYPIDAEFGEEVTTFTVDAERPLWSCGRIEVYAPLRYSLVVDADEAVPWLNGVETAVRTAAGDETSAACSILQVVETERGFIDVECRDLDDGDYRVEVYDLPADFEVAEACDRVTVAAGAPGTCTIRVVRVAGTAPPIGDDTGDGADGGQVPTPPATTTAAPDDPDADGPGGVVVIAVVIAALVAGAAWFVRSRPGAGTPRDAADRHAPSVGDAEHGADDAV